MYHKSIAVLLLITLFVFSGITFVGYKAGYDSFWFCILTILASTGFGFFIGAASRIFPILDITDNVNRLAVRSGVIWFKKLLSISRWDLITKQLRPSLNSKTPPLSLLQSFQSNFVAHFWGFLVHLLTAIFAKDNLLSVAFLLITGYFLHLLPSFLQLHLLWRVQKLKSLSK